MQVKVPHRWDLSPKEAAQLQLQLRTRLIQKKQLGEVRTVAGADIALADAAGPTTQGMGKSTIAYAGVIVYSFPDLRELERRWARRPVDFPYIPGLLVFREGPALLDAISQLQTEPDLLLFDAHGYSHPRRFGLACHMSVILDTPGIGVAKSLLIGTFEEPPDRAGAWTPLVDAGETIGVVVRTRVGVQPIFVSVGHRVDLNSAVEFALACTDGYRVPKPTREADHFVAQLKRGVPPEGRQPTSQSSLF